MNQKNEEEERYPDWERPVAKEKPSLRIQPLRDENRAPTVDPSAKGATADWMTATYWG
ncbi:MAG: hypothetical protein AB1558_01495 [Thermodesulfobacteriota bacterium]